MNPQEFATKIREKYPDGVSSDGRAYADIPDEELTQKIVEKYPVYKSQLKTADEQADIRSQEAFKPLFPAKTGEGMVKAGLKTAGNIPSSLYQTGKGVASAVFHPVETIKGIGTLGDALVRGGGRVLGEKMGVLEDKDTEQEASFGKITESLKAHFGSTEALQRTLTNDPMLVASLIAPAMRSKDVTTIARATKIPQALEKLPAVPAKIAQKLVSSSLKLTPTQVRKISLPNVAGTTPEKWLLQRGIKGSPEEIIDKLEDLAKTSKASVDAKLENDILIGSVKKVFETPKPVKETLDTLETLFTDTVGNEEKIARIAELKAKKTMSLSDINEVKRLVDSDLKLFKASGAAKEGAQAQGLQNLRNEIKTFIETEAETAGVPGIKELNKTTQVAKEISKAITETSGRRGANRILGLTDLIVGSVAGFGTDIGTGVGIVVAKKILENPKLKIEIANQLKKLSPDKYNTVIKAMDSKKIDASSKLVIQELFEKAKSAIEDISKDPKGGMSIKDVSTEIQQKYGKQINTFFKNEPPHAALESLKEFLDVYDNNFKSLPEGFKDKNVYQGTIRSILEEYGMNTDDMRPVDLARVIDEILIKADKP